VAVSPLGLRPRRWQRWTLHSLALAMLLSGLAWLIAHFFLRSTGTMGEETSSPIEPWALRLHGLMAYAFVFIIGSMSTLHILLGWRSRCSRVSGVAMVVICALLAVSALGLYYAPEDWHASTSVIHWCVGLGLMPLLWIHILAARASRHRTPQR
jgi:hypothetical protein